MRPTQHQQGPAFCAGWNQMNALLAVAFHSLQFHRLQKIQM